MALGPRLDLRQSQSLVVTPQLQQAIKLLALSNLELEAYLAEALEGNPLLDTSSPDSDGGGDELPGDTPAAAEAARSEEHTSELQSLMRNSYAVFCLKKKNKHTQLLINHAQRPNIGMNDTKKSRNHDTKHM